MGPEDKDWEDILETSMSQGQQLFMQVVSLLKILEDKSDYQSIAEIVGKNQNPHCGGDGSMSLAQWEAAMKITGHCQDLKFSCQKFLNAPLSPLMRDHHARKQPLKIFGPEDEMPF